MNKLKIPHIPTSEELWSGVIGVYFSLQARSPSVEPGILRLRRLEIKRVKEVKKYLFDAFRDIALGMPFLDSLHPFYRELIELLIDRAMYKHSLAKIGHATKAVASIYKDAMLALRTATTREDVIKARRMFLARIKDLLNDLKPELDFLKEAAVKLDRLPDIDPNLFTIVVAGMPNVGKSSFVRCVSSGKPKVAEYPFTTKEIHVGHLTVLNDIKIQVIDTPGLLDRPLSEKNKVELQAILALRHLAHVIVFIVDPTMHCGYSLNEQIRVLKDITENFSKSPLVIAINKDDIAKGHEVEAARKIVKEVVGDDVPIFRTSTLNCHGCREIVDYIVERILIPRIIDELKANAKMGVTR